MCVYVCIILLDRNYLFKNYNTFNLFRKERYFRFGIVYTDLNLNQTKKLRNHIEKKLRNQLMSFELIKLIMVPKILIK